MRCPKCGGRDSYVKDTRSAFDDTTIRRRRVCCRCKKPFTTYEIKAVDFRVALAFFEFLRKREGDSGDGKSANFDAEAIKVSPTPVY
jgi:transcriptional regulator NrdR family protein